MLVEEVDSKDPEEKDLCRLHTLTIEEKVEGEAKKIKEEYKCI